MVVVLGPVVGNNDFFGSDITLEELLARQLRATGARSYHRKTEWLAHVRLFIRYA
ncbi:MAG TPA: hypothetical protein VEM39_05365 [Myxococcaceae bacterium]|nr:hypothetical protein [Myxococcaceae bacterium]